MKAVRAKKWLFNKVLDWSYNNRNYMPFNIKTQTKPFTYTGLWRQFIRRYGSLRVEHYNDFAREAQEQLGFLVDLICDGSNLDIKITVDIDLRKNALVIFCDIVHFTKITRFAHVLDLPDDT